MTECNEAVMLICTLLCADSYSQSILNLLKSIVYCRVLSKCSLFCGEISVAFLLLWLMPKRSS